MEKCHTGIKNAFKRASVKKRNAGAEKANIKSGKKIFFFPDMMSKTIIMHINAQTPLWVAPKHVFTKSRNEFFSFFTSKMQKIRSAPSYQVSALRPLLNKCTLYATIWSYQPYNLGGNCTTFEIILLLPWYSSSRLSKKDFNHMASDISRHFSALRLFPSGPKNCSY